jgi:hypothetical protein
MKALETASLPIGAPLGNLEGDSYTGDKMNEGRLKEWGISL